MHACMHGFFYGLNLRNSNLDGSMNEQTACVAALLVCSAAAKDAVLPAGLSKSMCHYSNPANLQLPRMKLRQKMPESCTLQWPPNCAQARIWLPGACAMKRHALLGRRPRRCVCGCLWRQGPASAFCHAIHLRLYARLCSGVACSPALCCPLPARKRVALGDTLMRSGALVGSRNMLQLDNRRCW